MAFPVDWEMAVDDRLECCNSELAVGLRLEEEDHFEAKAESVALKKIQVPVLLPLADVQAFVGWKMGVH